MNIYKKAISQKKASPSLFFCEELQEITDVLTEYGSDNHFRLLRTSETAIIFTARNKYSIDSETTIFLFRQHGSGYKVNAPHFNSDDTEVINDLDSFRALMPDFLARNLTDISNYLGTMNQLSNNYIKGVELILHHSETFTRSPKDLMFWVNFEDFSLLIDNDFSQPFHASNLSNDFWGIRLMSNDTRMYSNRMATINGWEIKIKSVEIESSQTNLKKCKITAAIPENKNIIKSYRPNKNNE